MGDLQDLHAESRTDEDISVSGYFLTRNPRFYPIHARSPAVYRFQELVEQDLCSLQHTIGDNIYFANDNLTKAQSYSLKQLKNNV